jgi:hypothetical protein
MGGNGGSGFWLQATNQGLLSVGYPMLLQPNASNVLIGGTTDISGTGGLKVFGTTAASSTTSGALQVAGGVGIAGAGYFGGTLNVITNNLALSLDSGATSTVASYAQIRNGGGVIYFGLENLAGTTLGTGVAYGTALLAPTTFTVQIASVTKMTLSSTTATFAGAVSVSGTAATFTSGTGSPESVKTAPVGSLYTRTDGGASTTLYVKESGAGNTGWIAK